MSYILASDVSTLSFIPDEGANLGVLKNESVHVTPGNRRFNYKWSDRLVHKFSVSFVTSADANLLNTWWLDSQPLIYAPEYDPLDVSTVYITGNKLPSSVYEKNYLTLYKVKLSIEEFN